MSFYIKCDQSTARSVQAKLSRLGVSLNHEPGTVLAQLSVPERIECMSDTTENKHCLVYRGETLLTFSKIANDDLQDARKGLSKKVLGFDGCVIHAACIDRVLELDRRERLSRRVYPEADTSTPFAQNHHRKLTTVLRFMAPRCTIS